MKQDTEPTKVAGDDLVPDFDKHPGLRVTNEYAYWMGVVPRCPVSQIDCAGLCFPKVNERFIDDPRRTGDKVRIPVIGGLNRGVTVDHIAALRERLPRLVIRFTSEAEAKDEVEESGTGQNIGDVHVRVRKGYVITIPTEEQVAAAKAAGTRIPRYMKQPGDEPAVRYMYFQLCTNQQNPQRGVECPPPIERVGIEWPDEVAMDLMS